MKVFCVLCGKPLTRPARSLVKYNWRFCGECRSRYQEIRNHVLSDEHKTVIHVDISNNENEEKTGVEKLK